LGLLRNYSEGIRSVEFIISKLSNKKPDGDVNNGDNFIVNELPLKNLYVDKKDNLNPRYTFDSFVVGSFNELAHAAAQSIIKNPGHNYNPFFIYGPTGLGKTHLIQAIGNAIKEKFPNEIHKDHQGTPLRIARSVQRAGVQADIGGHRGRDMETEF
jgi:chromosomal replication initiator protein